MRPDQVRELYDDDYASVYDTRFLLAEWPKHGADFEASQLRDRIDADTRWLDVGCGTGYFLSLFPGVHRAGIDLSPAMVAQAREANPDADFVEERDFRDDEAAWHGQWTLVTCMWTAYNYVESMAEIEVVLENLARWTAPGGSCFIPVMDLEDIRPFTVVPYREDPDVWGGSIALTGITWTWDESGNDKVHSHLVAPHVGFFVEQLGEHFEQVEVLRYPPFEPGWVSRKAVLATRRRGSGDRAVPTTTIWHELPSDAGSAPSGVADDPESTVPDQPVPDQPAPDDSAPDEPAPVVAPPAPLEAAVGPAVQMGAGDPTAIPARTLLRELARRCKPDRRLWRSVTHRVRRYGN